MELSYPSFKVRNVEIFIFSGEVLFSFLKQFGEEDVISSIYRTNFNLGESPQSKSLVNVFKGNDSVIVSIIDDSVDFICNKRFRRKGHFDVYRSIYQFFFKLAKRQLDILGFDNTDSLVKTRRFFDLMDDYFYNPELIKPTQRMLQLVPDHFEKSFNIMNLNAKLYDILRDRRYDYSLPVLVASSISLSEKSIESRRHTKYTSVSLEFDEKAIIDFDLSIDIYILILKKSKRPVEHIFVKSEARRSCYLFFTKLERPVIEVVV